MSLFTRMKGIFKAKANAILNDIENPEEALELSLTELREKLTEMKKSLVEVTTIKKGLERDLTKTRDQIKLAEEQATLSLQADREDLAEASLEKKQDLANQEDSMKLELEHLEEQIQVIIKNKEQLEKRVRDLENKKKELVAYNKAADAQLAVKEIMTGVSDDMDEITGRIERAEKRINEKKARVSAIDDLDALGALNDFDQTDKVEKELKEIQRQSKVKEELQALKNKIGKETSK